MTRTDADVELGLDGKWENDSRFSTSNTSLLPVDFHGNSNPPSNSTKLNMATASVAKTLPRFLLPKLSWQASPIQQTTIRALSTPSSCSYPSRQRDTLTSKYLARRRQEGTLRPKTSALQTVSHRRAFHATARRSRDHHFDTLKFVQRLQEEGFTEAQSVAMMKVLSDVIEERSSKPCLFVVTCY